MPKSLGQIHTTSFNYEGTSAQTTDNACFLADCSAALSSQFNRNIRMMQSYKWVGADLVVQLPENINIVGGESTEVSVKGRMRYFAPTKGRCNALRAAYQQFRETARQQGVNPSNNKLFDFRVLPRALSNYDMNTFGTNDHPIYNLTTLDGINPLTMVGGVNAPVECFPTYNSGVAPEDTTVTSADFTSGLRTQVGTLTTQTDFTLNEGLIQSGNSLIADTEFEEIPFVLTFDGVDKRTASLQWRPDPALYVSVLGGFVEIVLDEIKADGATGAGAIEGFEMDIALHWAGWKSIVSKPRSKSRGTLNRTQKNIAKQVGSALTGKEAKALATMLKKLM
ncbi:hypothetical protein ES705_42811 [subsurface metagenome]